jgi:hypothetical protein
VTVTTSQSANSGLPAGVEGGIIGAVVAVGVVIAFALLLFLFRRRRRNTKNTSRVSTIVSGRTMNEGSAEGEYEIPVKLHQAQEENVVGGRVEHDESEIAGARLRYDE